MASLVTLSKSNRIVVPPWVIEWQGWKPGQKIAFIKHGNGVELVAVPTLDEIRGMVEGTDTSGYRDRSE